MTVEKQELIQTNVVESSLLKDRTVMIFGEITPELSHSVVSRLILLDAEDKTKEIKVYINTLGGDTFAGMAIYDTMQMINSPISTICVGVAFSTGCLLLLGGDKGSRKATKHARMMIHLGNSGFRGNTADVEVSVNELLSYTGMYISIYAERMEKDEKHLREDMDRDYFMNPEKALEYGLIDMII